MKELRAEIEIDAPAERVWRILTDFASYPDWNPFISQIDGTPAAGERLSVRIEPPGGRGMEFRPTVLASEPNRELRWLGRLIIPGLVDGEHSFRLDWRGSDRVRVVQAERFSGLLIPFLGGVLRNTERGFHAMNQALKARAEQAPA